MAETNYDALTAAIRSGELRRAYIFHGEERYLLDRAVGDLRASLIPEGLGAFDHRKFAGAKLTVNELAAALDTPPALVERALVEVWDYPLPVASKRKNDGEETDGASDSAMQILEILRNLPDYAVLVFVYDTTEFKPDKRLKSTKELLSLVTEVEFAKQPPDKLAAWISRHVKSRGRAISRDTAVYLAERSGGYMTPLLTELEKLGAHGAGEITRAEIDELVAPTLDAKLYELTDAIGARDASAAFRVLSQMFELREVPQIIIAGLSRYVRQLYLARCLIDAGRTNTFFADSGLRFEWQATRMLNAARKCTTEGLRKAVLKCSETALRLNAGGGEADLVRLATELVS
ncbi:MAG: DNA polymerase III subunit delta [Oscillospiraceae bacterium]|jgi:DNA polymerase-3 subunit delta|nr:DNA polymerase III subunit delta [Oscillospiraceae bacterium]